VDLLVSAEQVDLLVSAEQVDLLVSAELVDLLVSAEQVDLLGQVVLEEHQTGLLILVVVQLTVQIAVLSSNLQEMLLLGTDRFTPLKAM
jgi:hypothetical protein